MVDIHSFYDRFRQPYYSPISPSQLGKKSSFRDEAKRARLHHLRRNLIPVRKNGVVSSVRFPSGTLRPESPEIQLGNLRHHQYQKSMSGIAEYPIRMPLLNSSGSIDIFHNKNSLLYSPRVEEVKTVDTDYILSMTQPKRTAVSQLNAYLHATGTKTGTLTYLSRENANLKRQFEVNYQPGLLIADIAKKRQEQYYSWTQPSPIMMHYSAHQAAPRRRKRYRPVSVGYNKSRIMQ